ncbi:MAG: rhodanese-like domain-containing protein [Lawsonella clevelandensis]
MGHVPGALRLDWHKDLFDPNIRDFINGQHFASLMRRLGIRQNDTVVLYGDKSQLVGRLRTVGLRPLGHTDIRLLDGGRDAWFLEERPPASLFAPTQSPTTPSSNATTTTSASTVKTYSPHWLLPHHRHSKPRRVRWQHPLSPPLQRRLPPRTHPHRLQHPWNRAVGPDSRFLPRTTLEDIYDGVCSPDDEHDVITYCTMGEQASHTWFVLTYLLGCDCAYNYDGSWSEWGTAVRMPIVQGTAPDPSLPLPLSTRH